METKHKHYIHFAIVFFLVVFYYLVSGYVGICALWRQFFFFLEKKLFSFSLFDAREHSTQYDHLTRLINFFFVFDTLYNYQAFSIDSRNKTGTKKKEIQVRRPKIEKFIFAPLLFDALRLI